MFSVPLNPKLSENEFLEFVEFLKTHREFIYDVYFTSRIPPFNQDAMGDVFLSEEDNAFAIDTALYVQAETGIPVSATFNNITVRPDQQNLDLFIERFAALYDAGVRSATIPHTHWVATRQIQSAFPNLFIKNTILRNVTEPRDVVKLGEVGFHYVNIDRDLMRDYDKLLEIKRAKEYAGVKIALLANEGCAGGCHMMDEHYQFNNTRAGLGPQYFNDAISRVSCAKWDFEDPAIYLKTANLPPWREDWHELLTDYGIDVIKMHGRESRLRLQETTKIIRRYASGEEILFDNFASYLEETNMADRPINVWRKKIRTCQFNCWDCKFCDRVYESRHGLKQNPYVELVTQELVECFNRDVEISIPGLTSKRVQSLINGIAARCSSYLEIGSYAGATAAAALKGNNLNAYFVDNWRESLEPSENRQKEIGENSKERFIENIKPYIQQSSVTLFDGDLFSANTTEISEIDFFFYDGPHDYVSTKQAVEYFSDCWSDTVVMLFDDANWDGVVSGATDGILNSGLNVLYSKIVLNEIESERDFWNGLYMVVAVR